MVIKLNGDILGFTDGIICHQTNYMGIMGAGIAAAIRRDLLDSKAYKAYVKLCNEHGRKLLGRVQYLKCRNGALVANCFCQDEMLAVLPGDTVTSYKDMLHCFEHVKLMAGSRYGRVYIPYRMGCGIAGGDWNLVQEIISLVFRNSATEAVVVRKDGY